MPTKAHILIVDDQPEICSVLATHFEDTFTVTTACSSASAMQMLAQINPDVVVSDIQMPAGNGLKLMAHIRERHPNTPVILMSGSCDKGTAIDALRGHAFDLIEKPFDFLELRRAIESAIAHKRALNLTENALPKVLDDANPINNSIVQSNPFRTMVTADTILLARLQYCSVIATTGMPVLITGETGTGKDLLARALHSASKRTGSFIAVNVAGLDETMLADCLFGHVAGAFTHAAKARRGLIEAAHDGTLFLDEIGDLNLTAQIKLLRLLENLEYYPLGSDTPHRCTARIIAATHRDVEAMVASGAFRSDLYYRLRAHEVRLPSLRERRSDIPMLLEHFCIEAADKLAKPRVTVRQELVSLLQDHDFPGNVRELRAMIFDGVGRSEPGEISLVGFRERLATSQRPTSRMLTTMSSDALPTLTSSRDALVEEALRRAGGNQAEAARILGVTRQALNKRLSRKAHKGV